MRLKIFIDFILIMANLNKMKKCELIEKIKYIQSLEHNKGLEYYNKSTEEEICKLKKENENKDMYIGSLKHRNKLLEEENDKLTNCICNMDLKIKELEELEYKYNHYFKNSIEIEFHENLQKDYIELEEENEKLKKEIEKLKDENKELEKDYEDVKRRNSDKYKQIEKIKKDCYDRVGQLARYNEKLEKENQKLKDDYRVWKSRFNDGLLFH